MQENRLKGFSKAALQKTVHWAFDEHDRDGKALYRIWLIGQPETFCSAAAAVYLFIFFCWWSCAEKRRRSSDS
jgi:hypothetical protein